jgi:hypothetical protein
MKDAVTDDPRWNPDKVLSANSSGQLKFAASALDRIGQRETLLLAANLPFFAKFITTADVVFVLNLCAKGGLGYLAGMGSFSS